MIEDFLKRLDFNKNKKIILGAIAGVFLVIVAYSFYAKTPIENIAREDMVLSIPQRGGLASLDLAMQENSELRDKVKELISYDEAYLFVNYLQIDALVTYIMFLWVGLTPKEIETQDRQRLAETFIRRVYNLPEDEPIKNNPFLKDNPWADLFQEIKARLLMQGNGYKIYKGVAYYNSETDKMVVEGGLSKGFLEGFAAFVKEQPQDQRKRYTNNYLLFVNETLGLKNLNEKEKKLLKELGFL